MDTGSSEDEGSQIQEEDSDSDEERPRALINYGYSPIISPKLLYVIKTFDQLPIASNIEEYWNLRNLRWCEDFINPVSENELFQLQVSLCESAPFGISMHMDWHEAGQLSISEAIRIIEVMARKNEELARAMEKK